MAQNNLDVGITAMNSPLAPHTGTNKNVIVKVRNFGNVAVTSLTISWSINGVAQPDYTPTGVNIGVPSATNQVPTQVFTLPGTVVDNNNVTYAFWTKNPNGQSDANNLNDTLRATTGNYLSGTKVVGIAPSDYRNLTDAVNAIRYCGVGGDLTFKIKGGTYTEGIELINSEIAYNGGVVRKITFEPLSGQKDVLIASDANTAVTIKLTAVDRVTLNRLKILNRNIISGIGVQLVGVGTDPVDSAMISNCEISVDSISNSRGFAAIMGATMGASPTFTLSTAVSVRYSTFTDNKLSGGFYGVALNGAATPRDEGNIVDNNTIREVSYYGVYIVNGQNNKVRKNKVYLRPSADLKSTGFYLANIATSTAAPNGVDIIGNYVTGAGQYGIYLSNVKGVGGTTPKYVNVSNNMIAGGFFSNARTAGNIPHGLSVNSCGYINIYFNSIRMDAPSVPGKNDTSTAFYVLTTSTVETHRIYNNIFYHASKGFGYYNASTAAMNAAFQSNNNDIFAATLDVGANPLSGFAYWAAASRTSLTALITASGKDQNSISKDPFFFSPTDLHTFATELDGKGSTIPISEQPYDYDGELRDDGNPLPPDIGCDEFGPGGQDFAIIGITPDVFKYKKDTPWRIFMQYNGPGNGGGTKLYFKYKINGVEVLPDPDYIEWTSTLSGTGSTATVLVPAAFNINRQSYQSFLLTVYIAAGNIGDNRAYNDTINVEVCVGLEGTFLIDKNHLPDDYTFTSLQDAFSYLKCGVSGPTVFQLADGTYDEQLYLWKIRNSSATNTITFESKNSVFSSKLSFFGGTTENHATVLLNNAQHIILNKLTIENRNAANGSCVQFAGNAKNNTVQNCILKIDSTITPYPTSLAAIVSSRLGTLLATPGNYGQNAADNKILNNKIYGGYYGIAMFGQDAIQRDLGNVVEGNVITSFHKAGVYLDFADTKVLYNTLTGKFGMDNTAYAIFAKGLGELGGSVKNEISGNKITDMTYNGIYLTACFGERVPPAKKSSFVVANNMIGGGFTFFSTTTSGIMLVASNGISLLHNSINMDAPRSSSTTASDNVARCMIVQNSNTNIEAYNNNLTSTNGAIPLEYYACIRAQGCTNTGLTASDNNNFYTTYANKNTPLILIKRLSNGTTGNTNNNYTFNKFSSPLAALTAFRNADGNSGRETKSLAVTPQFEELPYDLHTNSPDLESKGGGYDITEDIDKQKRNTRNPDIGCDEYTIPYIDLDISKIRNPLLSSSRPNKIRIIMRNRGKFSLDKKRVDLKLTVTGTGGYSFTVTENVELRMQKINEAQEYAFNGTFSVPKGLYDVCVELISSTLPDDTVYYNNSKCAYSMCTGIEGDFYIGFASTLPGTDPARYYTTIQDAFNNVECGIAGPTFFNVNPGTYTERIVIPKYLVNLDSPLLTLRPYNTSIASNTDVIITQPTAVPGDPDKVHYTVRFLGSNFVKLERLNIRNTGATFGSAVHFTRKSSDNIVEGCKIEVNNASNSQLFYPVAFTSANKLNYNDANSLGRNGTGNKIRKSELIGGFAGVAMLGASAVDVDLRNEIDSCIIRDYYQFGIYTLYNTIGQISANTITPRTGAAAANVALSYNFGGEGGLINRNTIRNAGIMGIKIYGVEAFAEEPLVVANNWITNSFGNSTADSASGINIKRSQNIGVYYNSIRYNGVGKALMIAKESVVLPNPEPGQPPITVITSPSAIKVYNNIIQTDDRGDATKPYVLYYDSNDPLSEFNNNNYWSSVPNKFGYFASLDQNSFPIWQQNSAFDGASWNLLPKFVSPTDLNLDPTDTLIFDGKGKPMEEIKRDYFNRKRSPRATDIGSIEYEDEKFDLSIFKIMNERAVYGTNTVKIMLLNEGYSDLSGKTVKIEYRLGPTLPWIGTQTVQLTELKGRYDEMIVAFTQTFDKKDFIEIPLCVRIVPTDRLAGDTITRYETNCKDLCIGLAKGDYTIGKNGTEDFSEFSQAITALVCGFDSSIVFKISPGTYKERITIPVIKTTPDTTVTFVSATNQAKDVILQYENSAMEQDHHIVQLKGTRYVTFKNLTFTSKASARVSGIHLADAAAYNTVDGCRFLLDSVSSSNTLVGVLASGSIAYTEPGRGHYNTIRNCDFRGGGFGIRLLGLKENAVAGPNRIVNNTFNKVNTAAIDVFYSQVDSISFNNVNMRTSNDESVGINIYGALTDFIITKNKVINAGSSGLVVDSCRTISFGLIANNMIAGGFRSDGKKDYAMALKNTGAFPSKGIPSAGSIDIVFNSVLYDGTSDSASAFYMYKTNSMNVYNNIFANYGRGYAVDFTTETASVTEFYDAQSNMLYTRGNVLAKWKGIKCTDLTALSLQQFSPFTTINSLNQAGNTFDPLFRSHYDLHVNHADINGKGYPFIGDATDIDGDPRNPSTPDVGCDEFVPGMDAMLDTFLTPLAGQNFTGQQPVIVRVKNVASVNLSSFKVKYELDGVLIDEKSIGITVPPGGSTNVVFDKKFSTRLGGHHTLCAYTRVEKTENNQLVNNDFNNFNDTLCIDLFSLDSSDIGVSQILYPTNATPLKKDTTVTVRVTNYGNLTANTYKVVLKVNQKIKETINVTTPLVGKATDDFEFAYKLRLDSAVTFEICAYTILSDDGIPENDSLCTMISTVGIQKESSGELYSAYPNPTRDVMNFGLRLNQPKEVQVIIYDLLGKMVSQENFGTLNAGDNRLNMNLGHLSEGTYLYVMKAGDDTFNGRIVVIK